MTDNVHVFSDEFVPFDTVADRFPLLPGQFFPSRALGPEAAFMRAELEDLVTCLVTEVLRVTDAPPRERVHAQLQEDLEFLDGTDPKFIDYFLTFDNCCEAIGQDPEWIREGILQRLSRALIDKQEIRRRVHHGVPRRGYGQPEKRGRKAA